MVKFLKNIRLNIIGKKETVRYLKYAIGEVILVMVGILLALQVNNWNEKRKDRGHEIKLLKQLKVDLLDNFSEIRSVYRNIQEKVNSVDSIFIYLEENRQVDDTLRNYFDLIQAGLIFNNANTIYKNIESYGLKVLSNDSLRAAITKMYENDFKNIEVREQMDRYIKEEVLANFMQSHFKPAFITYVTEANDTIKYFNPMAEPIDLEALRKNLQFKNIILRSKEKLLIRLRRLDQTLKNLKILIDDVQNEIDRLER